MEAHSGGHHHGGHAHASHGHGTASVPGVYHAPTDHRHVDLGDLSGPLELIGLLSFAFALASLRRRELSLAYLTHTLVSSWSTVAVLLHLCSLCCLPLGYAERRGTTEEAIAHAGLGWPPPPSMFSKSIFSIQRAANKSLVTIKIINIHKSIFPNLTVSRIN